MAAFGLFAVGVELEVGLVLGDGFVFFLHLLRDLGEGEVGGGVVGLDVDGVFGAEIGALVVFVAHVELGDVEVFVDALVVGLDRLTLGSLRWTELPSGIGGSALAVSGRLGRWERRWDRRCWNC